MSVERNAATTRPPDAASVSSGSLFEETVPSGPRPPRAPSDGPPPIPDLDPAPEAFAPMIEAEPLAMGTDLETELGAEPASEPATWSAASAEAIGAEALEAIRPRLRAQLHDTLEKIAWESFSDLTETIVRQAVERVEQVAWEVIPQLAETLVREEIRRMKGEDS
jgi:hypothetical protein